MEVKEINIKDIAVLENIRQKTIITEDLADLMDSIKHTGLMQPIGVKEVPSGYILIWGFRRLTACKKLGHKTIQATIFKDKSEEMTEDDFLIANASENIHRKSVDAIELGRVCHHLRKKLSVAEIAVKMSIPKGRIESALDAFNRVPEKYRGKVKVFDNSHQGEAGMVGSDVARKVTSIRNLTDKQRELLFDWVIKEEKKSEEVSAVGRLMTEGLTLKEAIEKSESYCPRAVNMLVDKKQLQQVLDSNTSFGAYVKHLINRDRKGFVF